ncbi:MAG: hypothetical protein ACRDF4_00175 [Rhabdochlamydiaceae bacterium]
MFLLQLGAFDKAKPKAMNAMVDVLEMGVVARLVLLKLIFGALIWKMK